MTELDLQEEMIDRELRELERKSRVLASQKAALQSEKARLRLIQQTACDHPIEARDRVMVNNEPEYFCSLCGKDL